MDGFQKNFYCVELDLKRTLRTVGNDSTFYGPPTANQLRWYPNQIPEGFEMCWKVWEEITIPTYAQHRYGRKRVNRILDSSMPMPFVKVDILPGTDVGSRLRKGRAGQDCCLGLATRVCQEMTATRRSGQCLLKKRTISCEASGPLGSVNEP
jgi:uncharacterized protein DUF72